MSDSPTNDAPWLTYRVFLLLLAAALVAAFPGITIGADTFFARDFGALGYPGAVFLHDCLRHGQWPLWNPDSHCGVPYLAQMGQWYPPSMLSVFLPLPWGQNVLMLAHLWFGGCGMFWWLRRQQAGNFAAAFAAFAFVFNGITLSCLQWENYIASLAWLPWVAGSVIAAWRHGGKWLPFAAIAAALQVLTATPEITLLAWLFLAVVWLGDVVSRDTHFLSSARRAALVIVLAAGITMIQMLPFFDLLAHSQRDMANPEAAAWSMPGWGWINLFAPLFHCYLSPQGQWFQNGQDFLPSYYPGAGILALALAAIVIARSRFMWLTAGMLLFCWLMALGPNGFLYGPVKSIFPLIGVARFPIKFVILTAFLLPLLAVRSMPRNATTPAKPVARALTVVTIVLAGLMLGAAWFEWRFPGPSDDGKAILTNTFARVVILLVLLAGILGNLMSQNRSVRVAWQCLLLALLPLDALTHSPEIAPTLPASVLAPGLWQTSGKPSPAPARIMVSPDAEQRLLYSRIADRQADFVGKRIAEWYNLNLLDGVPKVTGAITLRPASFDVLERYLYYTPDAHCGRGLVDFLSVAWLSSSDNPTVWLARTNYLPLITAGQQPVFADDGQTLHAITAENFDPRETVYLPDSERPAIAVSRRTDCLVTNIHQGLNRIEADVTSTGPVCVVISQSYYHLWQASVDDRSTRLSRANLAFQAITVPAGTHHIKLVYRDPYLKIGAIISLLSLVACGFVWRRACRPGPVA